MLKVIENSSVNTYCIAGSAVQWFEWKKLVEKYFKVPSSFRISYYHVFFARANRPGFIFAKKLSTSTEELEFEFKLCPTPTILELNSPEYLST